MCWWEVAATQRWCRDCLVGIEVESVRAAECVAVGMRSEYRCAGAHRSAPRRPTAECETHLRPALTTSLITTLLSHTQFLVESHLPLTFYAH